MGLCPPCVLCWALSLPTEWHCCDGAVREWANRAFERSGMSGTYGAANADVKPPYPDEPRSDDAMRGQMSASVGNGVAVLRWAGAGQCRRWAHAAGHGCRLFPGGGSGGRRGPRVSLRRRVEPASTATRAGPNRHQFGTTHGVSRVETLDMALSDGRSRESLPRRGRPMRTRRDSEQVPIAYPPRSQAPVDAGQSSDM